jgi:hypothetical protein
MHTNSVHQQCGRYGSERQSSGGHFSVANGALGDPKQTFTATSQSAAPHIVNSVKPPIKQRAKRFGVEGIASDETAFEGDQINEPQTRSEPSTTSAASRWLCGMRSKPECHWR